MPDDVTQPVEQAFNAVLTIEGERTKDGRMIAAEALTWRELPIPLMFQPENSGHDGAMIVGRIEQVWRQGNEIRGYGHYAATQEGSEAAWLVAEQVLRWVSVDLEQPDEYEIIEEGDCSDEFGGDCVQTFHVLKARIMGATIVPFSAFPGAVIVPADSVIPEATANGRPATASAGAWAITAWDVSKNVTLTIAREEPKMEPVVAHALGFTDTPPGEWFTDPGLPELQRWTTIEDSGRIYGHLLGNGECHIGVQGRCITADDLTAGGFDYAMPGHVLTSAGDRVGVMPLAIKNGHADTAWDWRRAQAHYDDPSVAPALVAVGVDEYGVWFAGAMKPDATLEQVYTLRAHGVSGDWRDIGGQLRLIGACAVNVPGFPKVHARVASGQLVAVTAAGGRPVAASCGCGTAGLRDELERLSSRLAAVESVARPLRGQAAAEIRRKMLA